MSTAFAGFHDVLTSVLRYILMLHVCGKVAKRLRHIRNTFVIRNAFLMLASAGVSLSLRCHSVDLEGLTVILASGYLRQDWNAARHIN